MTTLYDKDAIQKATGKHVISSTESILHAAQDQTQPNSLKLMQDHLVYLLQQVEDEEGNIAYLPLNYRLVPVPLSEMPGRLTQHHFIKPEQLNLTGLTPNEHGHYVLFAKDSRNGCLMYPWASANNKTTYIRRLSEVFNIEPIPRKAEAPGVYACHAA